MPHQDPPGDAIRIHVDRSHPLPDPGRYLHPPCFDVDGNPVFFGSAILDDVVQPCKVTCKVGGQVVCAVPYRLVERVHHGPFTILPFMDTMELVPTSHGRIPAGYQPVVGGKDDHGRPLYRAVAWVRGERTPGRASEHLGAAAVLFDGREHYVYGAHEILCWRDDDVELSSVVSEPVEEIIILDDDGYDIDININHDDGIDRNYNIPDDDINQAQNAATDLDLSTVTPYPAATDLDGTTPLYFGSALLNGAVLPGKVVQMRTCQVLQDDAVLECAIGFSVLPFNADMELVPTSHGLIPPARCPVEGNYDGQGRKLYHAMLYVVGRNFPGMCAEHVGGAEGVLQGNKYTLETGYDILCWKEQTNRPADALQLISYKDHLAGQRIRKPMNGNEALTRALMDENGGQVYGSQAQYPWCFASALHEGIVTPCWASTDQPPCIFVDEGTTVKTCTGPYCILPYRRDRMMLVSASNGKIPPEETPVEGGRDKDGRLLYHAVGHVADYDRWPMIGMAAEHLPEGGAVIVCQLGGVHRLSTGYELLCWV